jgi:ketosteroid isomerase-like protein
MPQPADIHAQFEAAFNAGDLNALVALYEPGATLVPEPGTAVSGPDAIRGALNRFLALKGRIRLETTYAVQSGDSALLSCKWSLTGGSGPDGSPVELAGNSAEVVRRQGNGNWLYIIDHPFGTS